jgi:hypothetical protein
MPVACALFELYGDIEDEEFARMIAVMTPIEARELDPRPHLARRPASPRHAPRLRVAPPHRTSPSPSQNGRPSGRAQTTT